MPYAKRFNLELVSPSLNFCGTGCIEKDPYKWLNDWFAACHEHVPGGCKPVALAVHAYACDITSFHTWVRV